MSVVGTDLKINVHLERVQGLSMNDIDFFCEFFVVENRKIVLRKDQMIKADDDNYVACLSSSNLGSGTIKCCITAYIPDADFAEGVRKEIEVVSTGITIYKK